MKRQLRALGAVLANDRIRRMPMSFKGAEVGEGRKGCRKKSGVSRETKLEILLGARGSKEITPTLIPLVDGLSSLCSRVTSFTTHL